MMVSVETYLLRGKRRLDQLASHPGIRITGRILLYGGGGFLLSGAALWKEMMPFAAGLTCATGGLMAGAAAAGSILGYRVIWGESGMQGVIWVLGALILGALIHRFADSDRHTELLTAGNALLAATVGLGFQLFFGDSVPVSVYLLRTAAAGGGACLFAQLRENRNRMAVWISWGLGILAFAGSKGIPWVNLGCIAAGALAAAAPLPAAALAGIGLEASGIPFMTAGMCLSSFFRMLPVRDTWRRTGSPFLGCLTAMVLSRSWSPPLLFSIGLGGVIGAAVPWHWATLRNQSGTGAVQVQLEQTARVLIQLQRSLLDAPSPPIDEDSLFQQLLDNACGTCSCRTTCRERDLLDPSIISGAMPVACRKSGRLLQELHRSQEQLRFLKGQRRRLSEFRGALVQQYGFLAGYLQLLSDRLPIRPRAGNARFHIQVSVRTMGRELANGDRCIAFPGVGYRYYVLLCDGMGTGLGAATEGRQASELLKQMLSAGLPPQYAMGSLNSQLVLRGQAGAVTMDLAEVRLDSGRAAIYKWGAAPSIIFRRNKAEKIGTVTPPPGISISEVRETVVRLSLSRGEVLVLASDGIDVTDTSELAAWAEGASPGELAGYILREYGGNGEDDATTAVIRLRPVNLAT